MVSDSSQLSNRLGSPVQGSAKKYYGRSETQLYNRLDALLMVSKSCTQDSCRNPWSVLFPGGQVSNLGDAMKSTYDTFFANQPKVSYTACMYGPASALKMDCQLIFLGDDGYLNADEGPQTVSPFS